MSCLHVEGIQKTNALRWARADGFANRWVVLFGTHNDSAATESARNALIERYIVVLNELKAAGAKIAWVSPLEGSSATPTQIADGIVYRARIASRCSEEGFAYVDLHTDPDFSVAARNPAYFVDVIHLSAAGYERATQLFVATISSPSYEP